MLRSQTRQSPRWLAALVATLVLAFTAPLAAAPPEQPEPALGPIDLQTRPETDQAIAQRLHSIYAQLEPLAGVEVEVRAGVVHLRGRVLSLEAAREAETIAHRVEGVAAVDNVIEQEAEIERRLQPVLDELRERTRGWLTYVPLLLIAAAVIVAFWLLARWLARRSRRRGGSSSFARELLGQVVRTGIIIIGVVIALELLGATGLLGALLGTAGIVGIALGFAFKDMAENYIASVLLSVRQPFAPQDLVRIGDHEGRVVRLTSRATVLITLDGNHVRIPNATVFHATIVNFSRNPQRRFSFELRVAHEADLVRVQELAVATLLAIPGVLREPRPACLIERFGDSTMIVSVAGWINQRDADWLKVSSEAKRLIKCAFDRAGIDVPEPTFRIRALESAPEQPAQQTPAPASSEARDVSPDRHLEQRVVEERAALDNDDLLEEDGRPE